LQLSALLRLVCERCSSSFPAALSLTACAAFFGVLLLVPSVTHAQLEDEPTLPDVTVTGYEAPDEQTRPYAGGQVARGGRLGPLGNVDFMDAPFSQTTYTADFIDEQQASSLADLLVSDPSVRVSSARTNFHEYFSIRGFLVTSQDATFNGMYGLTPYIHPPLEMAERVEVLKGPSAALNGMAPNGSTGGTINIVPKRASAEPWTRLTANYLSDSQVGAHLDVGRRSGANQALGARLNASYRKGDTTVESEQEDILASLGLDYQAERLRASLDLLYQHQEIDNPTRQFAIDPALTVMPPTPATGLNYPDYGRYTARNSMATGRVEYDLGDDLLLYGAMGNRVYKTDVIGTTMLLLMPGGSYGSVPGWQILEVNTMSYEVGGNARFRTGPVGHRVAAAISRLEEDQNTFFAPPLEPPRINNLYNPVAQSLPSIAGITPEVGKYQESTLTSYALSDTLSFLDDRVQMTVGARYQSVKVQAYDIFTHLPAGDEYDDSAVMPVAGLLVKASSRLSLYANYVEDLAKGPSAVPPAVTVSTVLPPIRTKQVEAGAKHDGGRLATTISLFQIERPSAAVDGGVLAFNGEQRNRGIELNAFGEAARDVRLLGGVTFMQGKLTRTPGGVHDGNDAIAVPRMQASLGADWINVLPGFGLGARVIYTGSQYVDQANRLKIAPWTRVDASISYAASLLRNPLTLRLKVENLFDSSYWISSNALANNDASGGILSLSSGRTVMLSATMDFQGPKDSLQAAGADQGIIRR
jgi:iron complex outermembrane receptor protein